MPADTGFECPRCKRKELVRLHGDSDIFECLYCGYKKDLSRELLPRGMSWFFASLLGILFTLVMVMGG
ncbi:hypothetical protein [Leptolyngbya iicbica]|uniref:Uncharacterized protein n=2 Tax=Cyanophyceae TaxID=3028117 RepID=A0A4Q7E0P3_9CYAN|nr:hypothetical protein [Leptolyngbya sp. LK]RZM74382.1 hypothetical protein DYY88_23805 [Leptolyngbya sp. LK]